MIAIFNAFQLTCLFAAFPFIIGWLHSDPFPYSIAAFWVSIVAYIVLFGFEVAAMLELTENKR